MAERFLFMPVPSMPGRLPIDYWIEPIKRAAPTPVNEEHEAYFRKHPEDRERLARIKNRIHVQKMGGKFRKGEARRRLRLNPPPE